MPASSNGLPNLVVPRSTSEFHAMINAARAHHSAMHGQASDIAATLRAVLPDVIAQRGGARPGFMGADAKYKARRVVRPIMDAAALNQVIAGLYVTAYIRYTDLVVNAKDVPTASSFKVDG